MKILIFINNLILWLFLVIGSLVGNLWQWICDPFGFSKWGNYLDLDDEDIKFLNDIHFKDDY